MKRRHLALWALSAAAAIPATMLFAAWAAADGTPEDVAARRFDFGAPESVEPGYTPVSAETRFAPSLSFGWIDNDDLSVRDRREPDAIRRDFVFGKTPRTFRIAGLKPGRYLVTVIAGDMEYGNHVTRIKVNGQRAAWPLLRPDAAEFATLTGTVTIDRDPSTSRSIPRRTTGSSTP